MDGFFKKRFLHIRIRTRTYLKRQRIKVFSTLHRYKTNFEEKQLEDYVETCSGTYALHCV